MAWSLFPKLCTLLLDLTILGPGLASRVDVVPALKLMPSQAD